MVLLALAGELGIAVSLQDPKLFGFLILILRLANGVEKFFEMLDPCYS
jgi:hypothetical protein